MSSDVRSRGGGHTAGPSREGIRFRTRRAVQAEVAGVAVSLFLEHGFDETTVEDIIAAVGISRSSFFRYFATKEDVVLGNLVSVADDLMSALVARPDSESPWYALRAAMEPFVEASVADPDTSLRTIGMVTGSAALKVRHYEKTLLWRSRLIPEVARRLGADPSDGGDPRPAALVSCALGCLDAASSAWLTSGGTKSLACLLDSAMAVFFPHQ